MAENIKFIGNSGETVYIFNGDAVTEIFDILYGSIGMRGTPASAVHLVDYEGRQVVVQNTTARQFKRSLQSISKDPLGYIKFSFDGIAQDRSTFKGNIYINARLITHIDSTTIKKTVDNKKVETPGTLIYTHSNSIVRTVEVPVATVATQIERVLNRLEQDEEMCCQSPKPASE